MFVRFIADWPWSLKSNIGEIQTLFHHSIVSFIFTVPSENSVHMLNQNEKKKLEKIRLPTCHFGLVYLAVT